MPTRDPKKRKGRNAEAVIRKRCDDIFGLVVDGQPLRVIHAFVREKCPWDVNDYTLSQYIKRCEATFVTYSEVERTALIGRTRLRLERIYARASQRGDPANLYVQLGVLDRVMRLHGLAAPDRHELSGPGGMPLRGESVEELAAFFREKVEGQAKRLHGKHPAAEADEPVAAITVVPEPTPQPPSDELPAQGRTHAAGSARGLSLTRPTPPTPAERMNLKAMPAPERPRPSIDPAAVKSTLPAEMRSTPQHRPWQPGE